MQMTFSIVSPVYKAENIVSKLVERIEKSMAGITDDFEIVLVEDGSPDKSWEAIETVSKTNKRVKGIKLSRNFGQHYAITAGLDHAKGEWVVVMDCDLQDQPEEIEKLYNKAQEGYDVVLASRVERNDSFFKKFFSKLFFKTLSYLSGYKHDETIANFGIYHRKVIDSVIQMRESIRFFPTMVKWVGFKTTKVSVEHASRFEGKTSYNFKKLVKLAVDIILAYSDKPLLLMIKIGGLISLGSICVAAYYLIKWAMGDITVMGYTSLIVSVWFLSGVIIATLGIVGLYVGKTFEGVRNRPLYIIKKTVND